MEVNANNTSISQHFIGKICILNKYTDSEIIYFECWINGNPVFAKIDTETMQELFTPSLVEKMHEGNFIMECDAIIDKNSFLREVDILEVFESYNQFK